MRNLSEVHGDPVFDAQPVPTLLLDRQLTIRAVNRAYATSVRRAPEELLGMPMFEAFPDNPEDPDADGVANLHASLERTASQRKPHHMLVQRYDIKDTRRGGWLPRVWSPVNSPIVTDRGVIGLMHQVRDITPLDHDLRRVLHHYRDLVLNTPPADTHARRLAEHTDAVAGALTENSTLVAEIINLRRALTSRSTIDQAKGILMAERRCSPEEAFDLLRRLSSVSNVRLADVALALVYQAQGSGDGVPG